MRVEIRRCLFVVYSVALVLASSANGENVWSGFVNGFTEDFTYNCPDDFAISGVASEFGDPDNDRRWEYRCSSGGGLANVTASCSLQASINPLSGSINFDCPSDGYIAGFQSSYTGGSTDDRVWSALCCTRPFAALVNCDIPSTNWENLLEAVLNWTASDTRILAGFESFYSPFNRDRRWRFRQCEIQVSCGDPGTPANAVRSGDSFLYDDEVVFTCDNGYYQSSGPVGGVRTCQDTGLWSDTQPICTQCTDIENCADIRCTSADDQTCFECASNNGMGMGESAFRNLNTSCLQLCSWLGGFCYPGECLDELFSCNCSDGFTGEDCLNITTPPDLDGCSASISYTNTTKTTDCDSNTTITVYINSPPQSLEAEWMTIFIGPSPPPMPSYVQGFEVGVANTEVVGRLYRATSYPTLSVSETRHACTAVTVSPDMPGTALISCSALANAASLGNHTFLHGDRFTVDIVSTNGGYLDVTNLDTNTTSRHYYTGSPATGSVLYVVDAEPPTHCSVEAATTCMTNQPIFSASLNSSSAQVDLEWGGWMDDPSGVTSYRVELSRLEYDPVVMDLYEPGTLLDSSEIPDTNQMSYSTSFSLISEGAYSVVLITTDVAGNRQYARQILIYDLSSSLLEDSSKPLTAAAAVAEGSAFWHNSTTSPIIITGRGHFYSPNLQSENWLAPVRNHTPPVPVEFDDEERIGIPNALGVTDISYAVAIDQMGSESGQTAPSTFPHSTSDITLDNVPILPSGIADGDSVTIWFEAEDYKSNQAQERVLVHIDSSPPNVSDLGLVINSFEGQVLHATESFLDLRIRFSASDMHSGLYSIEWSIQTDSGVLIGNGNMPVTNVMREVCLNDSNCVCDTVNHCHMTTHNIVPTSADFPSSSLAQHDTDYIITVTATNHARLSSSSSIKITVDLTPPVPGVVLDGVPSQPEVDYQQDDSITIRWSGFFDPETAIVFYQYAIATECMNISSFTCPIHIGSPVQQTTDTMISWTAPSPGTYYTTVVGYNGAFERTVPPVCSDGFTVDKEPPVFEGVVIPGARVKPGLVRSGGNVWMVNEKRERARVISPTAECVSRSRNITTQELMTLPILTNRSSSPAELPSTVCSLYSSFSSLTYTTVDTVLNVSWAASDNIGIRGYKFGLSRSSNYSEPIDMLPMQTTAGQTHFSAHSSALVSGQEFYVIVSVTDLAMHLTTVGLGPIVIDTSPPYLNGSLLMQQMDQLVLVWWEDEAFIDDEDRSKLDSTLRYALDRRQYGTDVLDYTPLPSSPHSSCPTPNCISLDTGTLQLIPGNQYYVSIRVTNSAGLTATFSVEPFYQDFLLLPCLSVFEADPDSSPDVSSLGFLPQQEDVDILMDDDSVLVGWSGLSGSHLNASFSVALGSQPGRSDIAPFVSVDSEHLYSFDDLDLTPGSMYFATVWASNSLNQVSASSDGFLYLPVDSTGGFVWDGLSENGDVDYTASSSEVSARWYFPSSLTPHITYYRWGLFVSADDNTSNLTEILPYRNTGRESSVLMPVRLQPNITYINAVQACLKHSCLDPIYSNGFRLTYPPKAGSVTAEYSARIIDNSLGISSRGLLNISWSKFDDTDLSRYRWAISTSSNAGYDLVTEWRNVSASTQMVTLTLDTPLSLHVNHWVVVMAVNSARLQTSAVTPLIFRGPEAPPLIVLDVTDDAVSTVSTSDWRNLEHHSPNFTDIEYSRSPSSLSAAWPSIRYSLYNYSISTERVFKSCDQPNHVTCGSTISNAITVSSLSLTNGERYYFCIRAVAENFIPPSAAPFGVTACSNGITIDRSPPKVGCVQILPPSLPSELSELSSGDQAKEHPSLEQPQACVNRSGYQTSTSVLRIVWDRFVDSEENRNVPHAYGISYYEYAIGTSPEGSDIVGFTPVGLLNDLVLTELNLTPGITYFASIKGYDHVGLSSMSSSHGVALDSTPPVLGRLWLTTPTGYASSNLSELRPQWDLVYDQESGLEALYWGLGSAQGRTDLIPWSRVGTADTYAVIPTSLKLLDGQPVVLSLMALNRAGLSTIASSRLVIYDSTPPCPGTVFDGPKPETGFLDLDYSSDFTRIQAHWVDFTDPHTGTTEYWWGIGTCPNCTDVMPFISIGSAKDAERNIPLTAGTRYFISVRGCSIYSGCSTASSNGNTIDPTQPIVSHLSHGLAIQQYQASRHTISAHWSGFHDAESSISHHTFSAGVAPNDDSYVSMTTIPADQNYFIAEAPFNVAQQLPINRTVYVTVTTVNKAGRMTTVSSSGVFVTSSSPELVNAVKIDVGWAGSLVSDTQYSSSALRVEWQYNDQYTAVDQHFWSLVSESGTRLPIASQVSGTQLYSVLTDARLSSGDRYSVEMLGCNPAGLCILSTSSSVLVDSSPPSDGYFAVGTNTSASLPWGIEDGMSWQNDPVIAQSQLNITFTGFSDPHSNISSYAASVGSSFRGKDLYSSSSLSWYRHSNAIVYVAPVSLSRRLIPSEIIHVALWAVNGVGLTSRVTFGTFVVQEAAGNGHLNLQRSTQCQTYTCLGHCTCGRKQLCQLPSSGSCQQIDNADLAPYMQLMVRNVVPQYNTPTPASPLFTAVSDHLVGMVTYQTATPAIEWAEWSVGLLNQLPGNGLLYMSDQIWFPLLPSNRALFHVTSSNPLQIGSSYIFHVRAWYNSTHYSVFQSPGGVTFDNKGVQVVEGRRIRETSSLAPFETDFTSSLSQLTVRWNGVFSELFAGQRVSYEIGLGDTSGSDSARNFTPLGDVTSTTLLDLALSDNRHYYTTLRAVNPVGVVTTSVSDGFLTDTTPPNLGVVTDGRWYWDELGQTNTKSVSLRHFGFNDPNSQIHHFEAAVTSSSNQPASSELTNIGIRLKTTLTDLNLTSGNSYYTHVVAVNMAGVQSNAVPSNGFTVDLDRPVAQKCTSYSSNLLQNGSFEADPCRRTATLQTVQGWETVSDVKLVGIDTTAAYSGCHSLQIGSPIQQNFSSSPGEDYALSFALRALSQSDRTTSSIQVSASDYTRVFTLYANDHWQVFELPFTASASTTTITLSPVGGEVLVDDVQVTNCSLRTATDRIPLLRSQRTPAFISSSLAELSASWWIVDEQSGVQEYLWALGTVPGGEQIMRYSVTGGNSWANSDLLSFVHNSSIYLSVSATNNAGLGTVVYSEPILVDLTPPELRGELKEGNEMDRGYFNSSALTLDWSVIADEESGIASCYWAIGARRGSDDVQPFTRTTGLSGGSRDISVSHGTKVYSTIVCSNGAGRGIRAVSDGAVFLETPPTSASASLTLTSTTPTLHEPRDSYLPSGSLLASWFGFSDNSGEPLQYDVRISPSSSSDGAWVSVGNDKQLAVSNITGFEGIEHLVAVRAYLMPGLTSTPVTRRFNISSTPPTDKETVDLVVTWDGSSVTVSWTDRFEPPMGVPLYYEVSLGTQVGSAAVTHWKEPLETDSTSFKFSDARLNRLVDYFLSLTAITYSGHSTTVNFMISGTNAVLITVG